MEESEAGGARPTGGPVGEKVEEPAIKSPSIVEANPMITGYQKGKFVSVKLSGYLGKWVTLCFSPGGFTFV